MRARFWGVRGSVPTSGPDTAGYGGHTACVEVEDSGGQKLILDAGTGILALDRAKPVREARIDILLTHLHLDHIQGLSLFRPLHHPNQEIHIWGPPGFAGDLHASLGRYLSPPLFPLHLRDLPGRIITHNVSARPFEIGPFEITAAYVCHPGPTLGYRIASGGRVLCYIPDHEPLLGCDFPSCDWVSGSSLAERADLLIHDAQYTSQEYGSRIGHGHSSIAQAIRLAEVAGAGTIATFHHDPLRTDHDLDRMMADTRAIIPDTLAVVAAREGDAYEVGAHDERRNTKLTKDSKEREVVSRK